MMLTQEYPGIPLTMQRITPGNTLTNIAAGVYKYKEYTIAFDAGTDVFVEGDVFIGASSGAAGIIISVTVTTGTWLGDDVVGVIRFHSWNGIAFTNNEKIKVAADETCGDIDGTTPTECTDDYQFKGWTAKAVLCVAETQTQRLAFGAKLVKPDQTSKYGIPLAANASILITDASAIKNLYVVDGTAGSAGSTVFIGLF
jgi:hypothetical protein